MIDVVVEIVSGIMLEVFDVDPTSFFTGAIIGIFLCIVSLLILSAITEET